MKQAPNAEAARVVARGTSADERCGATVHPMRWLFHVVREGELTFDSDDRYAPASLQVEGFIHASFRETVEGSARLYFQPEDALKVLAIDPAALDVPVQIVDTPRGPMPHIHGAIPRRAVQIIGLEEVAQWRI